MRKRQEYFMRMCLTLFVFTILGCGGRAAPTRTPFPTWTPTPNTEQANNNVAVQAEPQNVQVSGNENNSLAIIAGTPAPAVVATPTILPPTNTPQLPAETPTESPTLTPLPTPEYAFELEAAEKFPTDSLAVNVVRIFLYVYSPVEFGLPSFTLAVKHNETPLLVDTVSESGLPQQTRSGPSAFTRFTNMNLIFVERQVGRWEIQLIDQSGAIVGPPAIFDLTADEITRELYLRYKLK